MYDIYNSYIHLANEYLEKSKKSEKKSNKNPKWYTQLLSKTPLIKYLIE